MAILSNVVADVFKLGGNLSEEQLPLPIVLLNIQTAYKKRIVDLQLSDSNHLVKYTEIEPSSSEKTYELIESDFGEAVLVQYSLDGINFGGNVDSVNKANLYLSTREGILAVSFWGNPKVAEFSIFPPTAVQVFRVYYEPHEVSIPRFSSTVDVNNNAFLTLVAIDAMLVSLEDVVGVDENWRNRKRSSLLFQKQEWETRWEKWTMKPSVQGVVRKRSYNERRR